MNNQVEAHIPGENEKNKSNKGKTIPPTERKICMVFH